MTVMQTVVGDKTYDISWEHPWKEMEFRGENRLIKVTNCTIVLNLGKDPDTDKPKIRILGGGCAKWPLESTVKDCDNPGAHSRLLLKGEKLGRDKARRISLTRALASAKLDKATRTTIWENYFRTFHSVRTGFMPPPPTPLGASVMVPLVTPEPAQAVVPGSGYVMRNPGIINKVVSHIRFWAPESRYVH